MSDTMSDPMSDTVHTHLLLADLADSPFNPRRAYPEAALAELADSIRTTGVLEPLLVRPHPSSPGYEIVFGHRRARAAALAGLEAVPCMVRAMSDAQAAMAQLHENIQRADMTPLDEADGMARLLHTHGLTADQVAAQLGVSRRQVYSRVKLAAMAEPAREALATGRIGVETANAIARVVGDKAQAQALAFALERAPEDKRGYRATVAELNDRFTLQLQSAIFEPEASTLVPGAGACSACPKRAGNALELFGDVAAHQGDWPPRETGIPHLHKYGPDVCTDPACFDAKRQAHLAAVAAGLQAKGHQVLNGNAARQALSATGEVKGPSYIALQAVKEELRKLPAAERPPTIVIVDQRTGKAVHAVKRADLPTTSVATAGATTHQRKAERSAQQAAEARAERQARMAGNKAIWHAMRAVAQPDLHTLRSLAHLVLDEAHSYNCGDSEVLAELLRGTEAELHGQVDIMPAADVTRLLLDAMLLRGLVDNAHGYDNTDSRLFTATAQRLGVDTQAIAAQVQADAYAATAAAAAAETAPTPPPAARAPKGEPKRGPGVPTVRYRCPDTGAAWSGRGLQPAWLKAALAQGKTLASFDTTAAAAEPDATAVFVAQHGGVDNRPTKPAKAGGRAAKATAEAHA